MGIRAWHHSRGNHHDDMYMWKSCLHIERIRVENNHTTLRIIKPSFHEELITRHKWTTSEPATDHTHSVCH